MNWPAVSLRAEPLLLCYSARRAGYHGGGVPVLFRAPRAPRQPFDTWRAN